MRCWRLHCRKWTSIVCFGSNCNFSRHLCTLVAKSLVEQLPRVKSKTILQIWKPCAQLMAQNGTNRLPTSLVFFGHTLVDNAQKVLVDLDMQLLQQHFPKGVCEFTADWLISALEIYQGLSKQIYWEWQADWSKLSVLWQYFPKRIRQCSAKICRLNGGPNQKIYRILGASKAI